MAPDVLRVVFVSRELNAPPFTVVVRVIKLHLGASCVPFKLGPGARFAERKLPALTRDFTGDCVLPAFVLRTVRLSCNLRPPGNKVPGLHAYLAPPPLVLSKLLPAASFNIRDTATVVVIGHERRTARRVSAHDTRLDYVFVFVRQRAMTLCTVFQTTCRIVGGSSTTQNSPNLLIRISLKFVFVDEHEKQKKNDCSRKRSMPVYYFL